MSSYISFEGAAELQHPVYILPNWFTGLFWFKQIFLVFFRKKFFYI